MAAVLKRDRLYQEICGECGLKQLDDHQIIGLADYLKDKLTDAAPVQILRYGKNQVRILEQNGGPWWVLADICKALNLGSPHKVADRLDEDEKGRSLIPTLGGPQKMTIINESGLYSVILRSEKPEAKGFKRWVTHEVLPAIRRTGAYGVDLPAERARWEAEAELERVRLKAECYDLIRATALRDGIIPHQN